MGVSDDGPPDGPGPAALRPVHLPGLNGLRAIAALTVLAFHIDRLAPWFGLPAQHLILGTSADYAVVLFFVLSGFLITYLLLLERAAFGRLDFRAFYARRILRIWPVYYVVLLATALLGPTGFEAVEWFIPDRRVVYSGYGLLLANVAYGFGYALAAAAPLWSVGVEEQFYAIWPMVVDRARSVPVAIGVVLVVYEAVKVASRVFEAGPIYNVLLLSCYGAMAIGGLFAWLAVQRPDRLRPVFHPAVQAACWLVFAASYVIGPLHVKAVVDREINAVVFAVLVVNVSCNPATIVALEHRALDALGRLSYGVYAYHMPVMVALRWLLMRQLAVPIAGVRGQVLLASLVTGTTLLVARGSYVLMESKCLALKDRFARVQSAVEGERGAPAAAPAWAGR